MGAESLYRLHSTPNPARAARRAARIARAVTGLDGAPPVKAPPVYGAVGRAVLLEAIWMMADRQPRPSLISRRGAGALARRSVAKLLASGKATWRRQQTAAWFRRRNEE